MEAREHSRCLPRECYPVAVNPRSKPVRVSLGLVVALAIVLGYLAWRYLGVGLLGAWLIAINVAVFPLWAWDKFQAGRGGWRVPEATLHLVAALGAAGTSLVCMRWFRHKTQKRKFTVLYSALLVAQIFALLWYLKPPSAD